jgi:hypothetical protein
MILRRILFVGVTFATTSVLATAPEAQEQPRRLLGPHEITKDIALSKIEETKGQILVLLDGQPICAFRNEPQPKRLSDISIQVWLLQPDGTALAQARKPTSVAWGNAGCEQNPVQFWFDAGSADPVAVAVSIDGTIAVREIDRQ